MTTKIEKEFFNTFKIEPVAEYCKHQCNDELDESACIGCKYIEKVKYPEITDRILLELITFLADAFCGNYCIPDVDYTNLKSYILCDCINYSNKGYIKVQIKELFNCNL